MHGGITELLKLDSSDISSKEFKWREKFKKQTISHKLKTIITCVSALQDQFLRGVGWGVLDKVLKLDKKDLSKQVTNDDNSVENYTFHHIWAREYKASEF